MKTQNNKTGNRNNRLQKALLRGAAVVLSFVLISFTVSAQGFWKQLLTNNSFGKVAMLTVEAPEANVKSVETAAPAEAENMAVYFETATDKPLELEDWMSDDAYFGAFNNILEPEVERNLEIEGWMMDESYFANQYAQVKDKELKIEGWMTDKKYWKL